MSLRVRYAPSPTGRQHIGNVRTALFDYLLAKANGGTFVLRIEDTDQQRFDPNAMKDIYETLRWLGIKWDEGPDIGGPYGPYVQSQRLNHYHSVAKRLIMSGHAYYCYCDSKRLERIREYGDGYDRHCRGLSMKDNNDLQRRGVPSVIRFKVPVDGATSYEDLLLGKIERQNRDINTDPVLLKSDGFPTYHLAAIVDDHEMKISHVLRSQEWISSAPLHVLVCEACGWQPPSYAHLPPVNGPDGKKLSKRHGATSVVDFRRRGFLPQALVNYLSLLGWSPSDDRELFYLGELEAIFSLERIGRSGSVFDHQKLEWFNAQHIRMLTTKELAVAIHPYLKKEGIELDDDKQALDLADLLRERLTVLEEAPRWASFLRIDCEPKSLDLVPKRLTAQQTAELLRAAQTLLREPPTALEEDSREEQLRSLASESKVKFGDLMMTLRLAITGTKVSPPLFGSMRLLGKQRLHQRLSQALIVLEQLVEIDNGEK